jgi:hypothetical protein
MGLLRAQCEVDATFFGRASGAIDPGKELDQSTQGELNALGYADGPVVPRGIERPNYCGH